MSCIVAMHLISGRTSASFWCIVRSDELGLILFPCVLGLAECETAIPSHALSGTNFLDRLLEPKNTAIFSIPIHKQIMKRYGLFLPRPVIGDVIFLQLLDNVVGRRHICAPVAGVLLAGWRRNNRRDKLFPCKVPDQTEKRDVQQNEVEDTVGPQAGNNTLVFHGKTDSRGNDSI